MKNDFTNLLTAVEPKEQEAFHHYLQCFYGNQKAVLSIFDTVVQSLGNGKQPDEIQSLYSHNKNALNALSDLKKWLLEFLALQEIRNNSTESKFLILEALRKREMYDAFYQKSKQIMHDLDKQKSPDLWHLFWKVRLSHISYFSTTLDKLQDYQADMHQLLYDLDGFYMAAKLKYSAELYSRSTILQEQYDIQLLDDILILIENDNPTHAIVKDFYLPMLEMAKDQSELAFLKLKSFLINAYEHEPIERLSVLLYLLNFAISRSRNGNNLYVQESFDLFQIGLNQSLFIASGYFPIETFLNITNIGCHLQKYDWLKRFVNDWSTYLPPNEKEEMVSFALARIAFEEKDYDKVIILLQKVDFKNFSITLNVRLLLIRAYYEQRVPDNSLILDYSNALYLYIYRNKNMGSALKTSALNFVKIFRPLVNGKSKKLLLKELDKKQKTVICYDWLKAKIEERSS